MCADKIIALINREIHKYEDYVNDYRKKMDKCEEFGKQYWLYHDKYQSAFIIKTYLVGLLKKIEKG